MRKTICVFLTFGVTFGLWAAGCRENPRTGDLSERRVSGRLGRAHRPAETAAGDEPVPALVDPEILAEPDQSNFARIRAILDREAALADQDGSEKTAGLFVIPKPNDFNLEEGTSLVWSKPAPPLPAVPPGTSYAEDLVAMAPAGVPQPEPAAGLLPPDSPLLNPGSIPGLFFGPEEYLKSITPPSLAAAPRPAAEQDLPKLEPLPSPPALEAARTTDETPAGLPFPEREKPALPEMEIPAETGGMELLPLLPVSGFGGAASGSVAAKNEKSASAIPAFPVPRAEPETAKAAFHPAPPDEAVKTGPGPFRPSAAKRALKRDMYEYEPDVPPILDLRLP